MKRTITLRREFHRGEEVAEVKVEFDWYEVLFGEAFRQFKEGCGYAVKWAAPPELDTDEDEPPFEPDTVA